MKRFITLVIALSFAGTLKSQLPDTEFSGMVQANNKPVEAVTVSVKGLSRGVVTDKRGNFRLRIKSNSSITLLFSAVGYQSVTKSYDLKQQTSDTIELLEVASQLDNVVVSGTMRPVSKMESPIPVEVYTPALFKKNPSPSIFESLQMVNGVQPQLNCNVCNTGDIHINGMEGPYTMILIDGMPIVSSLSTVYGLAGIPNSLVKRVEIVKGPASTLYGSEAVGGLINIITQDPNSTKPFKADVSSTSIGEVNVDLASSLKVGRSDVLLGVNVFNYSKVRDINHDNFTDVALQQRLSIFNKWSFNRNNGLKASLAARYVVEDRWGGEINWQPKFAGSDSVYGETIRTNRVELIGQYQLAQSLYADISYNYHQQDSYYGTTRYDARQHVAFGQVRWNKTLGKNDLLVGLPLRYTSYDDNSPATVKDGINNPDKIFLPGLFVQNEWRPNARFTLLTGMRYDYNHVHGSIITPRISVKFSPGTNSVVRLSGGNGYRVVNLFTEDHAALTGARKVIIANKLKPEQSWNANLNYTHNIPFDGGFINLDGSLFYTYFSNKIVGDFLADPTKIIYDNLDGHAVSKGLTLNADLSIAHRFKLNAGATFMRVYQVNADSFFVQRKTPQLFAPVFSATYAASYSIPRYALSFDWTGKINGPMHLPVVPNDFRPETSPLYCVMNLQVTKMFKKWEVYGGVKNLLNFKPANPLLHPDDPFNKPGGKYFDANGQPRNDTNPLGYQFDPSYNYAPVQGLKGFLGVRYSL